MALDGSRRMRLLFGECTLDADARELTRAGRVVHLEPQVFDVLVHLIDRRDHVVSKDELVATVWHGRIVSDSTLSSRINAARQAIGDSGEEQSFIRTIARRGFRFVGDIRAAPITPVSDAGRPAQAIEKQRPVEGAHAHADDAGPRSPNPPDLTLPDKPSIAVLAFTNLSGDLEQEYFADGIAEDIITTLSKSRWLFVIARNSSFAYKGRSVDVKQIGRALGVRYVLEGSVRRAGNRLRITGQLVDASTGAHLWAQRYDRDLTDIFEVQDEITASVASAIEPAMAQAEQQRVSRKPPDSLDAWEAYHRGLWHFLKQNSDENGQAKTFFQRAIDLDPGFAGGLCGLALTHVWDGWVYASRPLPDCVSVARPLAQRAMTVDAADPMVHLVSSIVTLMGGDVAEAVTFAEQAVSLNPNNAWAIAYLGGALDLIDRTTEGLPLLREAMRISPHDPMMWAWTQWATIGHYYARDYAGALEAADRVIRSRPDKPHCYFWKAAALGQLGRIDEANKVLRHAVEMSPSLKQFYKDMPPWHRRVDYERFLDGLRKAGLTE
jgi:TolB-like protein/DNA-binding winged helix-turn-helix (wHTH) protein